MIDEQTWRSDRVRDAASVLQATLDMLAKDFDSLSPAEARELVWLAKYEVDDLLRAGKPYAIGRRILPPQGVLNWLHDLAKSDRSG